MSKMQLTQWLPEGTVVVTSGNCHITVINGQNYATVDDKKTEAVVVFKDSLGEYRARFFPNMGWAWDA